MDCDHLKANNHLTIMMPQNINIIVGKCCPCTCLTAENWRLLP